MTFVNGLFSLIATGINYIGDLIANLFKILAKPLSYLYYFFDGVFYFFYQLFEIAVKVIMIFVSLFQFFAAIVMGFMRTITKMLTIDYNANPIHYPSTSMQGIQAIVDHIFIPMGVTTVIPYIVLAITWIFFVKQMIGLFGGGGKNA